MNDLTVPEAAEPKLTRKQRAFLKLYFETGNGTLSALKVYDCKDMASAAEIASQNLRKLKNPIKTYLEANGLSLKHLMATLAGGLAAKRIHTSHTEPDREVDDWAVRHKYLETASRWLGVEQDKVGIAIQNNLTEGGITYVIRGTTTDEEFTRLTSEPDQDIQQS